MVTPTQLEEWLREVEERPLSGVVIVRLVIQRLKTLTERNEELLSENIQLRSGNRVEEYEKRIANLEYQLNLLRRQFGDLPAGSTLPTPPQVGINLLFYTPTGKVLRMVMPTEAFVSGEKLINFSAESWQATPKTVRILAVTDQEEILFVFNTGRATTLAVSVIPISASPDWTNAYSVDPHASEDLAVAYPVARMTLFDSCVQVSGRGCAKKMMRSAFESHLSKSFIGAGVKQAQDKTACLTLCNAGESLALATREGYLLALPVNSLPYTIEEVIKLSSTDYIVSAFSPAKKTSLAIITQQGKVVHREMGWLETAASFKSHGQAILSPARREAGTRLVGAAALEDKDWLIALHQDGIITAHRAADLFASGAIPHAADLVDVTTLDGKLLSTTRQEV